MAALAAAAVALQMAGTIGAANAPKEAGAAQQQALNYKAGLENQQAGQERATAQRKAIQDRRMAGIALSNATSRAAASGAGATDPTVETIEGNIKGQGEYNALSDLYTGEERARGLENQAGLDVFQGDEAVKSAKMKAQAAMLSGFGTILQGRGASTLFDKHGSSFSGSGDLPTNGVVNTDAGAGDAMAMAWG